MNTMSKTCAAPCHGTTSGSVQGGGAYREYIEIVAPTDVPPASAPR